jgi:hypothetical protein
VGGGGSGGDFLLGLVDKKEVRSVPDDPIMKVPE